LRRRLSRHPKGRETNVEALSLKTPIYLFRDEEGQLTAIKILDIEEVMAELSATNNAKVQ